jgi:hypothetical protein
MLAMWTALLRELRPDVVISHAHASRAGDVLTLTGALPQTMHMARATLDLGTWALRLLDEDHRDGGEITLFAGVVPERLQAGVRAAVG